MNVVSGLTSHPIDYVIVDIRSLLGGVRAIGGRLGVRDGGKEYTLLSRTVEGLSIVQRIEDL